tara:strand:+ start:9663 stop:10049 length:387 start_codon:yes stop_codon:yes gene_type:complete
MVTKITKGIKISVDTEFKGTYYKDTKLLYAFEYFISIENQSSDVVQLNSRHWVILDSLNNQEVVKGEGVIGKKPVLKPGEIHNYKSGCLLASPFGAMYGYYRMINLNNTKRFNVIIPSFKLNAPFATN